MYRDKVCLAFNRRPLKNITNQYYGNYIQKCHNHYLQKPFVDWHNKQFSELPMEEDTFGESTTYLAKAEFDDPEKLLLKYFRQIFKAELSIIMDDEKKWPSPLTIDMFEDWSAILSYNVPSINI